MKKLFLLNVTISFLFLICPSNGYAQSSDPPQVHRTFFPLVIDSQKVEMVGPSGGNIEHLVIDPINPDIMYVGNWGSGVYKSVNGGVSWVISSGGITNPYIFSLAVDPINHQTIYAGTYGSGIFKSEDGGAHWRQVSNGLFMPSVVYVITIDETNPNTIYAGTRNRDSGTYGFNNDYNSYGGGVFKSSDGGENWFHLTIPGNDDYVYDIEIHPTNSNIVYAAMHWSGVFKSENAGVNWAVKNSGLTQEDAKRTRGIEISPNDPNILYLGTWGTGSFYYSSNGGNSWINRNSGLGDGDTRVWEITMDTSSPNTIYASTIDEGLFRTIDSGYTWHRIALLSSFHTTLVIHPINSQILFTGTKLTGLWKSSNGGGSWTNCHDGIQANNIVSALNDPSNPDILYVSVYGNGLWKSTDGGINWFEINTGLPNKYINMITSKPGNSNILFASVRNSGIYSSSNGGTTWTPKNSGIPTITARELPASLIPIFDHPTSMGWYQEALEDFWVERDYPPIIEDDRTVYPTVNTIAINPLNPSMMLVGLEGKGIKRSTDGGNTWQSTEYGNTTHYSSIIDPRAPFRAYTGMNSVYSFATSDDPNLYNWEVSRSGIEGRKISALVLSDSIPGTVYAGAITDPNSATDRGVYKSTNFGKSWSYIGLADYSVTSMLNYPKFPDWIIAGTNDGLFISKDDGSTWYLFNSSMWNQQISCLAAGYGDNLMLMGTDGGNLMLIKR